MCKDFSKSRFLNPKAFQDKRTFAKYRKDLYTNISRKIVSLCHIYVFMHYSSCLFSPKSTINFPKWENKRHILILFVLPKEYPVLLLETPREETMKKLIISITLWCPTGHERTGHGYLYTIRHPSIKQTSRSRGGPEDKGNCNSPLPRNDSVNLHWNSQAFANPIKANLMHILVISIPMSLTAVKAVHSYSFFRLTNGLCGVFKIYRKLDEMLKKKTSKRSP